MSTDYTFISLLTQTCSIQRRSLSSSALDIYGVPTESIATSTSSEVCLIQPIGEKFELDVKGKRQTVEYIGFFKITANLQVDDIVTFGGRKLIVIGVEDAAGQAHHQEVFLKTLTN